MSAPALPVEVGALLAGACHCGCGQLAPLVRKTNRREGVRKGQRRRYIHGHNAALAARHTAGRPRRRGGYVGRPAPGPWAWMCAACPWPLVGQRTKRRPQGFRRHGGRGLCSPCYSRASRDGTLLDFGRATLSRDDVLDDWEVLREQGYGRRVAAERLGMSLDAFDGALRRAARDGDERAVWAPP